MEPRLPEPKLRDDFRRELRARLMQEAVTALAPRPRGTAWTFLRPALGVGLAGILLVGGAGTAAAGSVPGDLAFPLKRAVEDLQVTLTFDDVSRVALLGQIADRRLTELQRVVDSDDAAKAPTASEEFAAAVARFRAAVDAVQQAAPQDKSDLVQDLIEAAREKHEAVLDEVKDRIDDERAQQAIERAKENEDKDTENDKQKRGDNDKTPRPSHSVQPTQRGTPRATATPRATQTQRTGATPRPSGGDRD